MPTPPRPQHPHDPGLTMTDFDPLWAMQPEAFAAFMRAAGDAPRSRSLLDSDPDDAPYELVSGVAVIPVEGVILRHSFFSTGLKDISAALDAALTAPEVRAVLLAVHSPGGQARGVKEVADAIHAARRVKPCAAWVDGRDFLAGEAEALGLVTAIVPSRAEAIQQLLKETHMDKETLAAQIALTAPAMTMGGGSGGATAADMQGTFKLKDGDIIVEGISFLNHVHACPHGGTTGKPQ